MKKEVVALAVSSVLILSGCGGGSSSGSSNGLWSFSKTSGATCYNPDVESRDSRNHRCKWYCGLYKGKKRFVSVKWTTWYSSPDNEWALTSSNIWDTPYNSSYCWLRIKTVCFITKKPFIFLLSNQWPVSLSCWLVCSRLKGLRC